MEKTMYLKHLWIVANIIILSTAPKACFCAAINLEPSINEEHQEALSPEAEILEMFRALSLTPTESPLIWILNPELYKYLNMPKETLDECLKSIKIKTLLNQSHINYISGNGTNTSKSDSIELDLDSKDFLTNEKFRNSINRALSENKVFILAMIEYKTTNPLYHDISFHNAAELSKVDFRTTGSIHPDKKTKLINYYFLYTEDGQENRFIEMSSQPKIKNIPSIVTYSIDAQDNKSLYLDLGILYEFNKQREDAKLAEFFYKHSEDSVLKHYALYWINKNKNQQDVADLLHKSVMRDKHYQELYNFALTLISRDNGNWDLNMGGKTHERALNILTDLRNSGYSKITEDDIKLFDKQFLAPRTTD